MRRALRGVPATIVVPEHAPQTKIDAIERFGGRVIQVPYDEWWQVLVEGRYDGAPTACSSTRSTTTA